MVNGWGHKCMALAMKFYGPGGREACAGHNGGFGLEIHGGPPVASQPAESYVAECHVSKQALLIFSVDASGVKT